MSERDTLYVCVRERDGESEGVYESVCVQERVRATQNAES